MEGTIENRLGKLRELMSGEHLAACIFTSGDEHNSEYVADHWKGREWISGFNGSAGTAVVTMKSAALWTDSRYFIAAEQQLQGTEYKLMRMGLKGTPSIAEWIGMELKDSDSTEVSINGLCATEAEVERLITALRNQGGITLRTNWDPLKTIWTDRPAVPLNPVVVQPMEYAGVSAHEKIAKVRRALRSLHADGMLVSALDDIAWLLNLRGSDIHCNPVFISYVLISSSSATLYVDSRKISHEVRAYLNGEGVQIEEYDKVVKGLQDYFEYNILMDPDEVNYTIYHAMTEHHVVRMPSPIPAMKAVKNPTETEGFHHAMRRDGVAMTRLLMWLENEMSHRRLTELSVVEKMEQLRSAQPLYKGPSFDTIAAYGDHAAIVHYEPTADTDAPLEPHGFLLLDTGGQYLDGTTDITRTIPLGPLTNDERRIYTLVLKGHIQLELLRFPEGASGTQLDAVARKDLWAEGLNYLHGTGHGVGSYLCVHEGPHQIRMEYKPTPLVAGMTVTDEPGIYLKGRFGVRIENTLIIEPFKQTECGTFLKFSPLTLCPIDTRPVIANMLSQEEVAWLNSYHRRVFDELSPLLSTTEKAWLRSATSPLEA